MRSAFPRMNIELPEELKGTGFPTWDEFSSKKAVRERWRGHINMLDIVDNAKTCLKHLLTGKTIYRLKLNETHWDTDKIEKLEEIALSEGFRANQMDVEVKLEPVAGGKCDMLILFVPRMVITP